MRCHCQLNPLVSEIQVRPKLNLTRYGLKTVKTSM